jgi:hypothetical protein
LQGAQAGIGFGGGAHAGGILPAPRPKVHPQRNGKWSPQQPKAFVRNRVTMMCFSTESNHPATRGA